MLDNLQPGKYHGRFVSLIFMRFLVFFRLAVGSTLWYKAALSRIPTSTVNATPSHRLAALQVVWLAFNLQRP
jgi:hypothetical protein